MFFLEPATLPFPQACDPVHALIKVHLSIIPEWLVPYKSHSCMLHILTRLLTLI